ncbi:SufE family protein [Pseudidiomarina sp. 1APP75-32.1]|uniref:SufE family protein n=1 Tax=Pseudidiomarina terrestris TaxID=2820060 RepID=A0AAW7QWZ9_9GAMM|nr:MULTISPECIES: SufE family protein [unclassified Pseudidiomarina]MDN7124408.1 SufE family protein [Pseudidiomarina sp. 1APP75-32.1]MDN7129301.1 SufE family protein [Pseudidiomarina sp. 1APR75-15]
MVYGKLNESDLSALQWEAQQHPQRLKFLIEQAAKLPPFPQEKRVPEHEVHGCEAKVWLLSEWQNERLLLQLDSASRVVKGLLALIFLALHQATPAQVAAFELDALLHQLGLQDLVSTSRRNGLRAVVSAIQN